MELSCAKVPQMTGYSHTQVTAAEAVRRVLNHEFGRFRNGSKLLGRAAGVSHRTAEQWLYGNASPSLESITTLMASCDGLAAAIAEVVDQKRKNKHERAACSGDLSASKTAGAGLGHRAGKSDFYSSVSRSDAGPSESG